MTDITTKDVEEITSRDPDPYKTGSIGLPSHPVLKTYCCPDPSCDPSITPPLLETCRCHNCGKICHDCSIVTGKK